MNVEVKEVEQVRERKMMSITNCTKREEETRGRTRKDGGDKNEGLLDWTVIISETLSVKVQVPGCETTEH